VVAERDDIVPARHGQALYQGLGLPKDLRTLPAAGHNDWWNVVDAGWWQRATDWLLEAAPR
jgi:uncharacterized protein